MNIKEEDPIYVFDYVETLDYLRQNEVSPGLELKFVKMKPNNENDIVGYSLIDRWSNIVEVYNSEDELEQELKLFLIQEDEYEFPLTKYYITIK